MIRRATLNDVAREAGVSIKTASRVLSGVETVNPTLRDKVQRAAAGLDYRPNRAAAMMRSGRSDMVGMIIRDLSNPFYSTLAAGVGDIAERHGRLLITCSSEGTPHRQSSLIEAVMSQRPVGLIITPTTGTDRQLISEADRRTPIVAVDELPTGIDIDTVTFDNSRGSRSGVATAVKLGRRNFVTISAGPQLTTMGPRVAGAAEAPSAAGLVAALGSGSYRHATVSDAGTEEVSVDNVDAMTARAAETAAQLQFARSGQTIVIAAGMPFGTPGSTNLLHIVTLTGDELKRAED